MAQHDAEYESEISDAIKAFQEANADRLDAVRAEREAIASRNSGHSLMDAMRRVSGWTSMHDEHRLAILERQEQDLRAEREAKISDLREEQREVRRHIEDCHAFERMEHEDYLRSAHERDQIPDRDFFDQALSERWWRDHGHERSTDHER